MSHFSIQAGKFSVELNSEHSLATMWSLRDAGTEFTFLHEDTARSGCWQAWLALLRKWVESSTIHVRQVATHFLICEDDVIFSRGLIAYLRSNPPPAGSIANLFCTAECHRPELMQWHRQSVPAKAQGSLALLIPFAVAKKILAFTPFPDRRDGTDHNLGTFCRAHDIPFVTHSPSLVLHSKLETSLAVQRGRVELRQAFVFAESIGVAKKQDQNGMDEVAGCGQHEVAGIGQFAAGYSAALLDAADPSRCGLPHHPHTLAVYQSARA